MRTPIAVILVAILSAGCGIIARRVHVFPRCGDGLPPLLLLDAACPPDGVCGYSCLPNRWKTDQK